MQLKENTNLQNGKFRILRVLGQGGFGITYLAENVALGRKVAIKEFFPKDFCGRDETTLAITSFTGSNSELLDRLKKRFLKEARNIAALDHPGIVKIHDIFEENGTAYYVMDYIDGENLNEIVKREGAMPEKRAVGYIRKVGEALSYIHARNMTHFDVKPANIVVRRSDDMPILIDFGLSKQYNTHGDATSTLLQGTSSGYSPLEMYNPSGLTTFSPQTDIYSLGATFYFLLTGTVPPNAAQLIESDLPGLYHLSANDITAISRAMKTSRSSRYPSVDAFIFSIKDPVQTNDDSQVINLNNNIWPEMNLKHIKDAKGRTYTAFDYALTGCPLIYSIGCTLSIEVEIKDCSELLLLINNKIIYKKEFIQSSILERISVELRNEGLNEIKLIGVNLNHVTEFTFNIGVHDHISKKLDIVRKAPNYHWTSYSMIKIIILISLLSPLIIGIEICCFFGMITTFNDGSIVGSIMFSLAFIFTIMLYILQMRTYIATLSLRNFIRKKPNNPISKLLIGELCLIGPKNKRSIDDVKELYDNMDNTILV